MKYNIFFLFIICFSCSIQKNSESNTEEKNNLYVVNNIIQKQNYYIIYLQRNDSTFKVISDITNLSPKCKKIKVGRKYEICLTKTAPMNAFEKFSIIPNLSISGMEMPDGSIITFEENSHYSIYRTKNLIGLCLQK